VKRGHRPVVITTAEPSPGEQLRSREIRYVLMMCIRAVCLVAAVILVSARVPWLWLWLPICAAGMLVVPWLAVILANDGPPKERYRLRHRRAAPAPEIPPMSLPSARPPTIIDADDWTTPDQSPPNSAAAAPAPDAGPAGPMQK
jgi:hypothetical protein